MIRTKNGTPEERAAWKLKQAAYQAAYRRSPAGKAAKKKHEASPKGKASKRKYRSSPKGVAVTKKHKAKYRATPKGRAAKSKANEKNKLEVTPSYIGHLTGIPTAKLREYPNLIEAKRDLIKAQRIIKQIKESD